MTTCTMVRYLLRFMINVRFDMLITNRCSAVEYWYKCPISRTDIGHLYRLRLLWLPDEQILDPGINTVHVSVYLLRLQII